MRHAVGDAEMRQPPEVGLRSVACHTLALGKGSENDLSRVAGTHISALHDTHVDAAQVSMTQLFDRDEA